MSEPHNNNSVEVIIEPSNASQHTHTIIFLHGRDSLVADFQSELFESQASDGRHLQDLLPGFKWVFPAAGLRPAARFGCCEMSQWFDIWSVEEPEQREEMQRAGLEESVEKVLRLLEREARLVPYEKIVLAGISQGCATAVQALLRGGRRCGAFVGFCGWFPLRAETLAGARGGVEGEGEGRARGMGAAVETPVLLEHCTKDDVVPVRNGEVMRDTLMELGMNVEWHAYEGYAYEEEGHWVKEPQGIDDLVAFLKRVC
ncbi:Acyl-protein thioesterase 1 [Lasiodiplodia theobromae]|uniref:Acyl-protein thioesterase 1 n=1 Tax=Lasiodiplodia theobromae TaxID=45133 RepID=A0A5N5DTA3_9PEZI|nr:Acyl-protein thioesterase 1 [Lasiodiplodia theobromae]